MISKMISKIRGVLLQKTGFLVKITFILGFDLFLVGGPKVE